MNPLGSGSDFFRRLDRGEVSKEEAQNEVGSLRVGVLGRADFFAFRDRFARESRLGRDNHSRAGKSRERHALLRGLIFYSSFDMLYADDVLVG
ncbi:MAG: hypothetical protein JXQ30_11100 [Spirochaetes bacterium]|nr:hypothetical protein [Spirochaetota bacterium]